MKKKLFNCAAVALSALISLSAVSCGPRTINDPDSGKTTINISHYGGGHGTEYMDVLVANFMEDHPEYDAKYKIKITPEKLHSGLILEELEAGYGEKQMYIMSQNDFVHFIYSDYLEDLSDVAEMKVDGADKPALKDKMVRYEEWQSIYSKYGEGLYAMPYADSVMGWIYDHDMFVDKNWYYFANEKDDGAELRAQGITYTEQNGKLIFQSSENKVNYAQGDKILTAGKDGKYGTYDDGQPQTVAEWDAMIAKISATGAKAFISSGQIGSYAVHLVSALFAQYSGLDLYNVYFNYDSKGESVKFADGTEEVITLENGYKVGGMEGLYKAYEFLANYFDSRRVGDSRISLHPVVEDGTKNHIDAQSQFLLGYDPTATNPQSAMLLDGAWWEYEARTMFNTLGALDSSRGYGQREYRYMLFPYIDGQASEKSAISCCESGAMIVPKDKDKDRLKVTKEFLAYLASDEALNVFLTMTGSIMPYEYTLTAEEEEKLTPFTRNMIELYSDDENIEVVRPQIAQLYSPLSYAGGRDTNTYFLPRINGLAIDQPFKVVRENSLDVIKTGLANYYSAANWAAFIEKAKTQGFFND